MIPNLMYATGHYRNGVLLSPLTAQLVADAMLENRRGSADGHHEPSAVREYVRTPDAGDSGRH